VVNSELYRNTVAAHGRTATLFETTLDALRDGGKTRLALNAAVEAGVAGTGSHSVVPVAKAPAWSHMS